MCNGIGRNEVDSPHALATPLVSEVGLQLKQCANGRRFCKRLGRGPETSCLVNATSLTEPLLPSPFPQLSRRALMGRARRWVEIVGAIAYPA
jgi:hypothetical protein